MPLVVLEAMTCGLPIASTKISGVEDLITAKEGISVEPKKFKTNFKRDYKAFR
jgi:glycosyltransferase involved in cell wall biosynthesis